MTQRNRRNQDIGIQACAAREVMGPGSTDARKGAWVWQARFLMLPVGLGSFHLLPLSTLKILDHCAVPVGAKRELEV